MLSRAAPGEIADAVRNRSAAVLPEDPEPFDALLQDLQQVLMPGITHWQHPRFFAYFPANSSPAAVLGELLAAGVGAQGMLWATGPAVTELEQQVLDALADALGLPEVFSCAGPGGGVLHDTASTATFTALLAAVHRASGGRARQVGVGHSYTVYGSSQAHSSLLKAVLMAGLGADALRTVPVDPATQAMDVGALAELIRADLAAGLRPVMVQAAVGTTGTGAVDPVAEIGALTKDLGVWLHVDAAWAGVAAICPELRWVNDGVGQYADSYVTNPHKWLLTTFDCSAFWVRDRTHLLGALSVLPEYLRTAASESGAVVDFRDWHPQLGRRFRSLKLWAVLRSYGRTGLQAHLRAGVAVARAVADRVLPDPRLALAAPPALGLVTFRVRAHPDGTPLADADADAVTRAAMDAVNASGVAYLSHTVVNDRTAIRWAAGGWRTRLQDVEVTWAALSDAVDDALLLGERTSGGER